MNASALASFLMMNADKIVDHRVEINTRHQDYRSMTGAVGSRLMGTTVSLEIKFANIDPGELAKVLHFRVVDVVDYEL